MSDFPTTIDDELMQSRKGVSSFTANLLEECKLVINCLCWLWYIQIRIATMKPRARGIMAEKETEAEEMQTLDARSKKKTPLSRFQMTRSNETND